MEKRMSLSNKYLYSLTVILILILVFATACGLSPAAPEQPAGTSEHAVENQGDEEHAMEHQGDAEHAMEHDEHDSGARIPNNGAVIRITAPEDGAVVKAGDDLVVEVETENFVLGEDGNHWHIYVDGESYGMIEGGDLDYVLRGLEPGQYEISAYLSTGTHEELEEGSSITITVE
jgi:hypothetical protein